MKENQIKVGDILYKDYTTGEYYVVSKLDKEIIIEICVVSEYEGNGFKYKNFENNLFYKKEDYAECLIYRIERVLKLKKKN